MPCVVYCLAVLWMLLKRKRLALELPHYRWTKSTQKSLPTGESATQFNANNLADACPSLGHRYKSPDLPSTDCWGHLRQDSAGGDGWENSLGVEFAHARRIPGSSSAPKVQVFAFNRCQLIGNLRSRRTSRFYGAVALPDPDDLAFLAQTW